MKRSEFWESVEAVFGSVLGRSYVDDIHLPSLDATSASALEAGVDPQIVWNALVEEMGAGERARFIYRVDAKDR